MVRVESASEMQNACDSVVAAHHVVVMSAAVADFRPVHVADQKIKKGDDGGVPSIVLERTPDILAAMGANKQSGQIIVGFAAETHDLAANATAKLTKKRVDLIVANDVSAPGVGFSHDTNAVTIFGADGSRTEVALADKRHIAKAVVDAVLRVRSGEAAGASVH